MQPTFALLILIFMGVSPSKIKLNKDNSQVLFGENAFNLTSSTKLIESRKSKRSVHPVCSIDGDLDMGDDIYCSTNVCPDAGFQCGNDACIPLTFLCDKDRDCTLDGRDEERCDEGGCADKFRCYSGECLELYEKCNQIVECRDGWSDEYNCTQPHECHLNDGKYLCKSGGKCIDVVQICDGRIDCEHDESDEFPLCEETCHNASCAQGCIPNPRTALGICYCFNGYKLSQEDNRTSTDIDECNFYDTCSQSCHNSIGSFKCACISGFELDADATSCKLKDNNASLIFIQNSQIRVLNLQTEEYSLMTNFGTPLSISYDARSGWVYWSDVLEKKDGIYKSRLDGSEAQPVATKGFGLPSAITYDWIAKNIYFVDTSHSQIIVCTENSVNCAVLLSKLDSPGDLTCDPNSGYLFWTQWGNTSSIMRAGLNGKNTVSIIHEEISWPHGISVDVGNLRVYWTDLRTKRIESSNYNGQNRMIIHSRKIIIPVTIDILGDNLYWIEAGFEIRFGNKFNTSKGYGIINNGVGQYSGFALYHISNQPITRENHCEFAGCSHICVLSVNSFKCICPVGYQLDTRHNKICFHKSGYPQIVLAYNNTLKTVPMDTIGGDVFKTFTISGRWEIYSIVSSDLEDNVFINDMSTGTIFRFHLPTGKLTELLHLQVHANGIDYDAIGGNMYWVDSKSINVLNLRTKSQVVLKKLANIETIDVVLAHDLRKLFIAATGQNGGCIMVLNMDGSDLRILHDKIIGIPSSITYCKENQRVYWKTAGRIESVGVDGNNGFGQTVRAPSSVTSYKGNIYWTAVGSSVLRIYSDKYSNASSELPGLFFGNYGSWSNGSFKAEKVSAVVHFANEEPDYDQKLLVQHECSPRRNKCSHICLLTVEQFKGTCKCPAHLELDFDGKTCVVERNQKNSVESVDEEETYDAIIFTILALFVSLAIAFVLIWRIVIRRRASRRIVPTKYIRPTSQSTLYGKPDDSNEM